MKATVLGILILNTPLFGDSINGGIGFNRGGPGINIDYQTATKDNIKLGGQMHVFPKNEDKLASGITSAGIFIRTHFVQHPFDIQFSPGIALHVQDPISGGSAALCGPTFAMGFFYRIKKDLAIGIENLRLWSWIGNPKGQIGDDYSLVKLSFNL